MTLIPLSDGRQLDVEVSGPDDALPLIFHHGTPGALTPERGMRRSALSHGWRFVTYSRAGYGSSTRNAGRQVIDVVPDVEAILDHLGAPRCLIGGKSGGGPHALATGAALGERVAAVVCIAGVAPYGLDGLDFLSGMGEQNVDEFTAALAGEAPLRAYLAEEAEELREVKPADLVAAMDTLLPAVDRAVLTDEYGEDMAASCHEALRTGIDGWVDDDLAFTRPWGFEFSEIAVPTFLWQGSADLMVPAAHGEWLAERIPGVTAHIEAGQGHLSIAVGAVDRMFEELAGTL